MQNFDPKGYYQILGVRFDADAKSIKQNYREQAKIWHPDYNTSEEALEKFQKISVAYETLQDDKTRLMYDLLAQAYNEKNFPDMFALKVYKNKAGFEDTNLRAVVLKKNKKETKEICNFKEAKLLLLKNFFTNFWNIKEIIYNLKNLENHPQENLSLLIHNTIAYEEEGKFENSYLSALQALEYANDYQKGLLNYFIERLKVSSKPKPENWNFKKLRLTYMSVPLSLFAFFVISTLLNVLGSITTSDGSTMSDRIINYYQEVKFKTGGETVDDVVVAKIVSIPVDIDDNSMLFHTKGSVNVMYGPSKKFDVLIKLPEDSTVRVTGFSPDKTWFRVMLDNGDMGFLPSSDLEKGMSAKPSEGSKIYRKR